MNSRKVDELIHTLELARDDAKKMTERRQPQSEKIDKCCLLHGNHHRVLESFQTARRIAPQLTRYYPRDHETV